MEFTGNLFYVGAAPTAVRSTRPARREVASGVVPRDTVEAGAFITWLFAQVGLNAGSYRLQPLLRRMPACLRLLRVTTAADARRRLERHPPLLSAAVDSLLLGVTQFFRDDGVFLAVGERVLPDLLGRAARIRVWSAACSDGPELYSVAMLLEEAGHLTRAELLGTDCRPEAITRAAAGAFEVEALLRTRQHGPQDAFVAVGTERIQVNDRLRAATRWRQADLLAGPESGPWDLILCRNFAIYLEAEIAARMWRTVVGELRPGGYLITGKADRPPAALGLLRIAACVYQRPEATHAN